MTAVLQTNLLTTRPFTTDDLPRLVAWYGLEKPAILGGRDAVSAANAFLVVAEREGYMAICPRANVACREAGLSVQGPIACMHVGFNGHATIAYVDRDFVANTSIGAQLDAITAQATRPTALRIAA